jgi:hypothetical protein
MIDSSDMIVPQLGDEFILTVQLGSALAIGTLPTGGKRAQLIVDGGRITGERLTGDLITGACIHMLLDRADGVSVVEISYPVRTADGQMLRMVGQGYRTGGEAGAITLTIAFEVDENGPHAWLGRAMFLAYGDAGSDLVLHVAEVR